jgi:hypothetical protein
MPSNHAFLDPDIVQPTKYVVPPTGVGASAGVFAEAVRRHQAEAHSSTQISSRGTLQSTTQSRYIRVIF